MSLFSSFHKIGEQKGRKHPAWGHCYQWKGKEVGKGHRRVKIVQILCPHVCEWKNDIIPRIGVGGKGEMIEEVNSSMIYLLYCENFCK
jgi:hypothetical protein